MINPFELETLTTLNFDGRGEAFIEDRFVTPLLMHLGYEIDEYEVYRHGDDAASFKLKYPPVSNGAKTNRTYNPDYVPTIRKKSFWIIEAKTPKNLTYPFDPNFITQGLQYSIHPEIQAKYLVITNGLHTAIYDTYQRVYFSMDKSDDLYTPIFEFTNDQIIDKWEKIFDLLSVQNIREKIEKDILKMFGKLASSSFNPSYPMQLMCKIAPQLLDAAREITEMNNRIYCKHIEDERKMQQEKYKSCDINELYNVQMELPLSGGTSAGTHYVTRQIKQNNYLPSDVIKKIINDYEAASYFKKENMIAALCSAIQLLEESDEKIETLEFLRKIKDEPLPLHNKLECLLTRLTHKLNMIYVYPDAKRILMDTVVKAPEIVQHVFPPTWVSTTYFNEILLHSKNIEKYKGISREMLDEAIKALSELEANIEKAYKDAKASLPNDERGIVGFDICGQNHNISFNNIIRNILGFVPGE